MIINSIIHGILYMIINGIIHMYYTFVDNIMFEEFGILHKCSLN